MILLLRRPITYWNGSGTRGRLVHRYRLLNLTARRGCAATYKGAPKNNYWYAWSMYDACRDGWKVHKPPIGLPQGA